MARKMERRFDNFQKIVRGTPEFSHHLVFNTHPIEQKRLQGLSQQAMQEMMASQVYRKELNIPVHQFQLQEHSGSYDGMFLKRNCEMLVPRCPRQLPPYRQADGSCNNEKRPDWGAAGTSMGRLLAPVYVDGVWEPRLYDTLGKPLPSARDVSRKIFPDVDRPHSHLNIMVMQFGQFIGHDVTQSASVTDEQGNAISCCTSGDSQPIPDANKHPACMAIPIARDDEFYGQFGRGCINFVRSSLAPNPECRFNYGQQISKVTHFLDGSVIYGSDEHTQHSIREHSGGRLRMFQDYHRQLLPVAQPGDKPDECVRSERPDNACFVSGDGRTNQIISLTTMHMLFAREHNRIAGILCKLNPRWTDDVVFLEAKRVVVAEFQLITYREWLPLIIGSETMKRFSLNVRHLGFSHDYDPHMNPSITSEFTTSAFRFGHSTVDGKFKLHHRGQLSEIIDIPDVMFNPNRLRLGHFYDEMLRTMLGQPMQEVDSSVSRGLSQHLFRGGNPFGLDLVAFNVQRGRDHGIRPYNDYLEVSGAQRIKQFSEFGQEIGHKLSHVYATPDDIDLWVGGLMEESRGDALVGPTFADIIADQFVRFRRGDRYFFEHGPEVNPGAFTEAQLEEIRKVSLARLICDNSDHVHVVQKNAFIQTGVAGNNPEPCESIPGINFHPWKV